MKIQNYLKPNCNNSTRRKFIQRLALYGCLLFILIAVIFLRFSNANVGEGLTRLEFNWLTLLYLVPMTVISAFLSVMFLKRFSQLYVCKNHTHRARLADLLRIKRFDEVSELIKKSSDAVIRKYSGELIKAVNLGENKIKVRDIDLNNLIWEYGKVIPTIIGFMFSLIGVSRVMFTLGELSNPSLQNLFAGISQSILSSVVGSGFSFLAIIYFFVLTIMKNRMTEIERSFLNKVCLEVDSNA